MGSRADMRIALFTDSFLPQINGVVTATLTLAKGLADRGHRVYIIAPKYKGVKEFRYPNVVVERMVSVPALFYPEFKFTNFVSPIILNFLRREKIDIVHFQTPSTVGAQGIISAKVLNIPLVGTFHTFITDAEYLKHAGIDLKIVESLAWNYSKFYYNRCDLITCPTESAKKELRENGMTNHIKVISNGIDKNIFDNSKSQMIKRKYNPRGPLLLFVGRIAYEKNLPYLLECFRMALSRIPSAKLLMVGDGPQMAEIKEEVKNLGLSNNVIITGLINHSTLVKSGIFGACDLFITASTTETQGITLLEAQANGIVSVAVNAKGVRDVIKNNYNGFLVREGNKHEFADKIVKLLTDRKTYSKMRNNTLKEIKKHDIPDIMDIWEKEYTRIIKNA